MGIRNTEAVLQYTQTLQSAMSWTAGAGDTLSSCYLAIYRCTTMGHTLGLYITTHSQLCAPQHPNTSSELLHRQNWLQK